MQISTSHVNAFEICRRRRLTDRQSDRETGPKFSGVATGWTGVDMSTPLLPEAIPEIDANPMTFLTAREGGGASVSGSVWHVKFMG